MVEDFMNKVDDRSNDKSYFTLTPRIVWALCSDVYEYALWNVVKDIAGDEGECYVSTENLATLAMMSVGKVSECRARLIDLGLFDGEMKRVDSGQMVWHLSIPDLWPANINFATEYRSIADRVAYKEGQKSLHHMKPSPHEGSTGEKPSPHETKNNIEEEQESLSNAKTLSAVPPEFYRVTYYYKDRENVRVIGKATTGPWMVTCPWCKNDMPIDSPDTAVECLCGYHELVVTKNKPAVKVYRLPESVEVYYAIVKARGVKYKSMEEWHNEIASTVTDVDRWRLVVKEYISQTGKNGKPWSALSVDRMLGYYREDRLPGTRKKAEKPAQPYDAHEAHYGKLEQTPLPEGVKIVHEEVFDENGRLVKVIQKRVKA